MTIFTKRNALVGFATLKAISRLRARRKPKRSAWKLALLVVLGLVSLGVLAGLGAVVLHRQREPRRLEGYAEAEEAASEPTTPEAIPAT